MVAEAAVGSLITEVLPLGFGKCKLQVQVPVKSGMTKPEELCGKKVATSFEILAGEYYGGLDGSSGKEKTVIEYVGGSVEAACALGLADGIGKSLTVLRTHFFFADCIHSLTYWRSSLSCSRSSWYVHWLLAKFALLLHKLTSILLFPCFDK